MTQHGTRGCYARGCRNIECVEANADYQRRYRQSASALSRQRQRDTRAAQHRAQIGREAAAWAAE